MWNRRDTDTPATDAKNTRYDAQVSPSRDFVAAPARAGATSNGGIVNIGQSIFIRGELTGDEDLTIEGKVEGKIDLKEHNLTIGPNGRIQAEITSKTVIIRGEVKGNIAAGERVELAETGRVTGDIVAPRIVIADGARFKGSVDMTGGQPAAAKVAAKDKAPTIAAQVISDSAPAGSRSAARS